MSDFPVEWLGHASFRINGEKTIYIDPYEIKSTIIADIILITHDHFDHCSIDDIKKVSDQSTKIYAPESCNIPGMVTVKPGESHHIGKIVIETVPAYNTGKKFHPQNKGYVGYIVTIDGQRIYHAGDTDLIPEMKNIKADIVLLPIGGTYTMDAKEAALAANIINPKYAVPMHYGSIVGSIDDADVFENSMLPDALAFNLIICSFVIEIGLSISGHMLVANPSVRKISEKLY